MTPYSLFSSTLTTFLAQHHGCQGTTDLAGERIPTQAGDVDIRRLYTPKQKAQIAKGDAKHGVTAPVRYGLHSVTRSCSRRAYRSNSETSESHSGSDER